MTAVAVLPQTSDVVKATIDGLHRFIEAEVLPLEQRYKATLQDERQLFRPDGRLVDDILAARNHIRHRSAQAGFYTMFAPQELGGGGLGRSVAAPVLESLYRKYGPGRLLIGWANGFLTSPVVAKLLDGPSPIFLSMEPEMRQHYLPALIAGDKTVCFALTEPGAGSDLWGLQTQARRDGGGWLVSGTKQWITNAPYADYALVFAVTDGHQLAQRQGGITCFLVDASCPGYQVNAILPLMGHLGSDLGLISLDEVRLDADHVIGPVDRAFDIAMSAISEARLSLAASCLGLAEWALDRSLEYAQQRQAFGLPLAEHQAIQFMLADIAIDIYTTKYMVLQTAHLLDDYPRTARLPIKEISIAKAYGVEMLQRVMDRAIQIHGAMGLSNELCLEEGFRIARTLRIPDGTSEIQRRTIARQLLKGDTAF